MMHCEQLASYLSPSYTGLEV